MTKEHVVRCPACGSEDVYSEEHAEHDEGPRAPVMRPIVRYLCQECQFEWKRRDEA